MQKEASPANPRRVKVAGRRGIYYRVGADGKRRYEFDYYGTDGKRRWLTVDGDPRR